MVDIEDVLAEAGVEFRRHGEHPNVGRDFVGIDCPVCTPNSHHFRLGIAPSGGCSCWVCGRMSLVEVLHDLVGGGYSQWRGILRGLSGSRQDARGAAGRLRLPDGLGELLPCHRHYLGSRGFDPDELAEIWGIKGVGLASRLAWSVWIPWTLDEEVVSWTCRFTGSGWRYCSAAPEEEKVKHKELLGGSDLAGEAVAVVEGPMDAFRVGAGAVWCGGARATPAQVLRLSRYPVRVVCLDSAEDAQRQARELCRELSLFPGVTRNVVLESKDPGCASGREVEYVRSLIR